MIISIDKSNKKRSYLQLISIIITYISIISNPTESKWTLTITRKTITAWPQQSNKRRYYRFMSASVIIIIFLWRSRKLMTKTNNYFDSVPPINTAIYIFYGITRTYCDPNTVLLSACSGIKSILFFGGYDMGRRRQWRI